MDLDVGNLGSAVWPNIDLCAGACGQLLVSGNEIGMQVGLEDVFDLHAVLLSGFQVNVHIALGIDDDSRPLRCQHVRIEG